MLQSCILSAECSECIPRMTGLLCGSVRLMTHVIYLGDHLARGPPK